MRNRFSFLLLALLVLAVVLGILTLQLVGTAVVVRETGDTAGGFQNNPENNPQRGATNLIANPGFEDGLAPWNYGLYPPNLPSTGEIVTAGCASGNCFRMQNFGAIHQAVTQGVGTLEPGRTYLLSVSFNAEPTHYANINLYTDNWRDNCSSAPRGKSSSRITQGTGNWTTVNLYVRIPENDGCGPTANHQWTVYLYGQNPVSDSTPIYYDDISLTQTEFNNFAELEEQPIAGSYCLTYNDALPLASCPGFIAIETNDRMSGANAVRLLGTKTRQDSFVLDVPIEPNSYYKLAYNLKIRDRLVYNYLGLDYQTSLIQQRPNVSDTVEATKGIWSGMYGVLVDGVQVSPSILKDNEYRSHANVDWHREEVFFKTKPDATHASIEFVLYGFDGKLLVDGVSLERSTSFIDDRFFHIPITQTYQGMAIARVSTNPVFVETNAGKFYFNSDRIVLEKEGTRVGEIIAEENTFSNLSVTQEQGNVVLENANILASVGADSVLLLKTKQNVTLLVTGPRPAYSLFQAGHIFVTDYSKGMVFSPLRSTNEIREMPFQVNPQNDSYQYLDSDFEQRGLKFWRVLSPFNQDPWEIEFRFSAGGGFFAEIFPPKAFDFSKYCKERVEIVHTNIIESPRFDFSYRLQHARNQFKYGLLWLNGYAASINPLNPPEEYCQNEQNLFVDCGSSQATRRTPVGIKTDIVGPYVVGEPEAMRNLVAEAHRQGLKLIVYTTPEFYYTYTVDTFLENIRQLLNDFDLDGVYYDGLYTSDPLKSLELVRKTRNLLGNKFFLQHDTLATDIMPGSREFRVPHRTAFADAMVVGEGTKLVDNDIWKLNYCSQNVSNTASKLLPELRPVNYTLSREQSIALTLTPQQQIDKTLACNGLFTTAEFVTIRESFIHDSRFQYRILFNPHYYFDRYNEACLPQTCGDGVCDVGETILSCQPDCAPVSANAVISTNGDEHACSTPGSVAQWVLGNNPLYALHFSFDGQLVKDDSGNQIDPSPSVGVSWTGTTVPRPVAVDQRKTFLFDGTAVLFGDADRPLQLANTDFSLFATFKTTNTAPQTIFALDPNNNFQLGTENGKVSFSFVNNSQASLPLTTIAGSSTVNDGQWHAAGIVFSNQQIKLFVDGRQEAQTSGSFRPITTYVTYLVGGRNAVPPAALFIGYLDDLFVANRALTPNMIQQYQSSQLKTIKFDGNTRCIITNNLVSFTATACGNNQCEAFENCQSCPRDCNCSQPPSNQPPTAHDQTISTLRGTPVAITLDVTDENLSNLAFTRVSGLASGTLGTYNRGMHSIVYAPSTGFVGNDQFTYTVTDAQGLTSSQAIVTITVSAPGDGTGSSCNNSICELGENNQNCPADCPLGIVPGQPLPPSVPLKDFSTPNNQFAGVLIGSIIVIFVAALIIHAILQSIFEL